MALIVGVQTVLHKLGGGVYFWDLKDVREVDGIDAVLGEYILFRLYVAREGGSLGGDQPASVTEGVILVISREGEDIAELLLAVFSYKVLGELAHRAAEGI